MNLPTPTTIMSNCLTVVIERVGGRRKADSSFTEKDKRKDIKEEEEESSFHSDSGSIFVIIYYVYLLLRLKETLFHCYSLGFYPVLHCQESRSR